MIKYQRKKMTKNIEHALCTHFCGAMALAAERSCRSPAYITLRSIEVYVPSSARLLGKATVPTAVHLVYSCQGRLHNPLCCGDLGSCLAAEATHSTRQGSSTSSFGCYRNSGAPLLGVMLSRGRWHIVILPERFPEQ